MLLLKNCDPLVEGKSGHGFKKKTQKDSITDHIMHQNISGRCPLIMNVHQS